MSETIIPIQFGGINAYILRSDDGHFVLVDTAYPAKRDALERALTEAGCGPDQLELVILTHGDSDHVGNGAWLRQRYGCPIACHAADAPMIETGDMSVNRREPPDRWSPFFRIMGLMARFMDTGEFDPYSPDILIDESYDLAKHGLEARVVHLPGHSPGSIGVLTGQGDLIAGDLIYNMFGVPDLVGFVDDMAAHRSTIARLIDLGVTTVFPGHGKPFAFSRYLRRRR